MEPPAPLLGDLAGSLRSIMLFPDDLETARRWHALLLAKRPLVEYRAAGHKVSDAGWTEFTSALRQGDVSPKELAARQAGGRRVANTVRVLWAMICQNDPKAGWQRAIDYVGEKMPSKDGPSSRSHIRSQLNRFSPALHLWGAWALEDWNFIDPREHFAIGQELLDRMIAWDSERSLSSQAQEGYLGGEKFTPWRGVLLPEVRELPRLSLPSSSTKKFEEPD